MSPAAEPTATPLICLHAVDSGYFPFTFNFTAFDYTVLTDNYEGWNYNSGNYLFTTDTK